MADIELVIKITEEEYIRICDEPCTELAIAVRNGTPLPKGHGRLIDADEITECEEIMNTISGERKFAVRMDDIRNVPTIIEADEAESEEV